MSATAGRLCDRANLAPAIIKTSAKRKALVLSFGTFSDCRNFIDSLFCRGHRNGFSAYRILPILEQAVSEFKPVHALAHP
jgi:hypothetical protein